jgi:hypothetical protein
VGNSETEGRHGALGFEVGGQVMIWSCSSRCGLCTGFYLEPLLLYSKTNSQVNNIFKTKILISKETQLVLEETYKTTVQFKSF